jgi:hypothetical protein
MGIPTPTDLRWRGDFSLARIGRIVGINPLNLQVNRSMRKLCYSPLPRITCPARDDSF